MSSLFTSIRGAFTSSTVDSDDSDGPAVEYSDSESGGSGRSELPVPQRKET